MIKLIYKAAKPYLYPNLARSMTKRQGERGDYYSTQVLSLVHAFKAGWYMLELQANGCFELAQLEFRFENKQGLPFPIRANKLMKRIIYLANPAGQLELDFKVYGEGRLTQLRLVPIKASFAQDRMLQRLLADPLANQASLLSKLKQRAALKHVELNQVIFAAYNKLFCQTTEADYHYWIEELELDLIKKFECLSQTNDSTYVETDYQCLLASDCTLYPSSKTLLMKFLNQHPEAVLVYPDQDLIDDYGNRSKPWFKTAWNYDLFLSQDYISSGFVCKAAWYAEHQALFTNLGTQQALAILLPSMTAQQILHLPLVLVHQLSSAANHAGFDVNYALERAHLLKSRILGLEAVKANQAGLVFDFKIPEPKPLVSLIIPTRNKLTILKPCVMSILEKTSYENYEILILDNQSSDQDILAWFTEIQANPRVRVLAYNHPFNYSAINNFGVQQARGSIIGLINNDVEVIAGAWLSEMVAHACREEIGCVGAKLYYSNGQIQHAGVILGLGHVAGHAHRFAGHDSAGYYQRLQLVQNYSAVTGACLLVRRALYEQVGGLNEHDLPVAYNDVDFCLRVRALGYRNLWTPHAELYHHESVSRGEDDTPEKKARFDKEVAYMRTTWSKELEDDPCYNPNLSRLREDFSLREIF